MKIEREGRMQDATRKVVNEDYFETCTPSA
jgi:hypothetical protein